MVSDALVVADREAGIPEEEAELPWGRGTMPFFSVVAEEDADSRVGVPISNEDIATFSDGLCGWAAFKGGMGRLLASSGSDESCPP